MSYELKLHLFLAIMLAIVTYSVVRSANRSDSHAPFHQVQLLPVYLSVLLGLSLLTRGNLVSTEEIFQLLLRILPILSVYYILLLAVMPVCRTYLTPQSCALLWFLPTFLYACLFPGLADVMQAITVITISRRTLQVCGLIWLTGFTAVMIWKISSHLWFRHKIVKSSREIKDEAILNLWKMQQASAKLEPWIYTPPVYSPLVSSPLSIGLYRVSTLLVLPEKEYTPEELSLIFRHEIVHIERKDAVNKLFLTFCTALCWFNPFMWKSMFACSADLELSCDEAVLHYADTSQRQQYAQLILHTAGDERGFTTCLSASAKSVHYRLTRILNPVALHRGTLLLPLITFMLIMSTGIVTFAVK